MRGGSDRADEKRYGDERRQADARGQRVSERARACRIVAYTSYATSNTSPAPNIVRKTIFI